MSFSKCALFTIWLFWSLHNWSIQNLFWKFFISNQLKLKKNQELFVICWTIIMCILTPAENYRFRVIQLDLNFKIIWKLKEFALGYIYYMIPTFAILVIVIHFQILIKINHLGFSAKYKVLILKHNCNCEQKLLTW